MSGTGSIFATYSTRENRVTATLMAVLERVGLDLTDRILANAAGEATFELVTFQNQPSKEGDGVPDAEIRAGFRYLFETKTSTGAIGGKASLAQIHRHLARFHNDGTDERLFLLTPDSPNESTLAELADCPVTWITFRDVARAVEGVLADETEPASEQQRFLLRDLVRFFEEENLLDLKDVVVVAARWAYPAYLETSAYICQPERPFRDVEYLGFYTKKQIKPEIARIQAPAVTVLFSQESASEYDALDTSDGTRMADLIRWHLDRSGENDGTLLDVRLLSGPDDPDTVVLEGPIGHAAKGAFVRGQRYASIDALRVATTTDSL